MRTLILALTCLAGATMRSHAQTSRAVVDGTVTDTNLVSLGDATVSVLGSTLRVTTTANGRFRISGLGPGEYILLVRRLGYAGASVAVNVPASDTLRVAITLQRAAITLDTVSVRATSPSPRLAEFENRRAAGLGQFMTQAQIEKRNSVYVTDLLASFQAIHVETGKALNRRSLPSKSCPFQFFIDGVALPTPQNLDADLPSPKEIAAIEVYQNSANVPLQYKTINGGGFCGVILLWTRDGSAP